MKYVLALLSVLLISCKCDQKQPELAPQESETSMDISDVILPFKVYDYDGLKPLIHKEDDKIHVVNFWATWCAPCIKELPYFEQLQANYDDENVELLLVSLDFPRQYQSKLVPFLEKNKLKSKIVALDDVDQNRWIPAIDSSWSGAIPATIIYKGDQRRFYERSFNYDELEAEIKQFLN